MPSTPRVAAIHDLSAFGRCSLTVVTPVLSAMGVQCCPIPTAYLSTHTGGFTDMVRVDLTDEMEGTLRHWESLRLTFNGVYTGYLASPRQAELCIRAVERLKARDGIAVVDPVLGDGGHLYASCTPQLGQAMAELCAHADVITPNLTEAAFLLDREYRQFDGSGEEGLELARALSDGGRRSVVLTGVSSGEGLVGCACFDRTAGTGQLVMAPRVDGSYHGTGDLFAAVLTGGLVKGAKLADAAAQAVCFVSRCAAHTRAQDYPRREGVDFEPLLGELCVSKV